MSETKTNNPPASKSFVANLHSGDRRFWLLIILLCFLIPPAGIVLAFYLVLTGLSSQSRSQFLSKSLLVLAISLLGAGAYVWAYHQNSHGYERTYTKLDTYKLPGQQKNGLHDGATFLRPTEFQVAASSSTSASLADYAPHSRSKNAVSTILVLSGTAGSIKNTAAGYPYYVKHIDDLFNKPTGTEYQNYKSQLDIYLQAATFKNSEIELSLPKAFKNANINKDAWLFDFTARSKTADRGYNKDQEVENGKLILAFGNQTYYYFVVHSLSGNWQKNTTTWQKVLDSLKIDQ